MTDTEKEALERRIDELCAEVEQGKAEFKKMDAWHSQELKAAMDENAKLRELMYERAHAYAIQNMTEDELRITATNVMEDNAKLRELVRDMWQLINDLDATPYVTERHGNNPAITWLDDDWSVHESCRERMRELGIEVPA